MKRVILVGIFMILILSLITTLAYTENKEIVIQGSTTVLPIAQKCAEVFMQKHPEANISVRGGGSGTGIAALIEGICDIADSSRPIKEEEIKKAKENNINPVAHIIAKDGIAVIVHPTNPISKLTIDQVRDIYTGKISNWKQLGGKDQKIVVVSRDVASGTYECFNEIVLKKQRVRPDALLQASNMAVASTVKRTKGSIGYIGLGYINPSVKVLNINGVEATFDTVMKGIYPISRPLFMYTNGKPEGLVKEFIEFVLGPEGQKIVEKEGFVPIKKY